MSTDDDFKMYQGLLILFDTFDHCIDKDVTPFEYCTDDVELNEVREKYQVELAAGGGDELSQVLNLLDWISTSTYHKGDIREAIAMNTMALMEHAYQKDKEHGINCRMKATILTEMLLSISIKSRILSLHPLNLLDGDNHVVSQVWLSEQNKWIIVDPTTNSYFMDKHGGILDAIQLRAAIVSGEEVTCSPKTSWDVKDYLAYMAKNLFYMHSPVTNGFGCEDRADQKWVTLCPYGFDGSKRDSLKLKQIEEMLKSWNSYDMDTEKMIDLMKKKINNREVMYTHSASSFMAPADAALSVKGHGPGHKE
jgi:hypothetical protein